MARLPTSSCPALHARIRSPSALPPLALRQLVRPAAESTNLIAHWNTDLSQKLPRFLLNGTPSPVPGCLLMINDAMVRVICL